MQIVTTQTKTSPLTHETTKGILIHEKAEDLPNAQSGPFVRLGNGELLCVAFTKRGEPAEIFRSCDEGDTWKSETLFAEDAEFASSPTGALLCTSRGTVILACANVKRRTNWTWDPDRKDAPADATLPTCVTRSMDHGHTWEDPQTLHEEWTGATRDIIETRDGRIVFASMKVQHNPGRHSVLTYGSDDEGLTWTPSNVLDLGGNGHHDGLTEGTFVQLKDGSLLHYMRTNWGQFWRALSHDDGRTWHPYGPSGVEASSAPGILGRLASGRLALAWNRPRPEGEDSWPLRGGDGIWSATPASNYRHELSVSFSEDEGTSWSAPVVVARNPESDLSYPCLFEPSPGVLWISAHRWDLHIKIREEDLLG